MSDDALVDALARKLAGEMWDEPHTQDWWRRRVRALLPDTRAYWTDEARGDAHLVPPDEYEVAVVAQKQWREEALEARAERDALRAEFQAMTDLHDAKHRDWQKAEAERDALAAENERWKAAHQTERDRADRQRAERVRVVADLREKVDAWALNGADTVSVYAVLDLLDQAGKDTQP